MANKNGQRGDAFPLPAIFTTPFDFTEPRTRGLWDNYRARGGDAVSLGALAELYAPLIYASAQRLKRRSPDFYVDEIEELVSDALPRLIYEIQRSDVDGGRLFNWGALRAARDQMKQETISRHWHGSRRCAKELRIVRDITAKLTQEHGRIPTPEEVTEQLRLVISNPLIQIGDVPAAAERPAGHDLSATPDRRERDPHDRAIDAEVMRVVRSELSGTDRRIVELVIRGESIQDIGRRLGLKGGRAQVSQRVNGALWLARCNARIAAYVGCAPAERPRRTRHGLPSIMPSPPRGRATVAAYVERRITRGLLPPGSKLPSIPELAAQMNLSRATVCYGLQQLQSRGLIESRTTTGYYVRAASARARLAS